MKFLAALALLGASLDAVLAIPQPGTPPRCTTPRLRKEWSRATASERSSYINAVKCLTTKPSKIGKNHRLYDDFVWVHATIFQHVHNVAAFLPWHRYFITLYEASLTTCGYSGPAMYWDWVASSSAPSKAAVFSPTTGFGGNGNQTSSQWGTNCVLDGPFKTLQLRYWNEEVDPHCLLRIFEPGYPELNITEMYGDNYSPAVMAQVNAETTFHGFAHYLEDGPHTAVHSGVGNLGGDMGPQSSSPNGGSFCIMKYGIETETGLQTLCSSSTTPRLTACGICGSSKARAPEPLITEGSGSTGRLLPLTTTCPCLASALI